MWSDWKKQAWTVVHNIMVKDCEQIHWVPQYVRTINTQFNKLTNIDSYWISSHNVRWWWLIMRYYRWTTWLNYRSWTFKSMMPDTINLSWMVQAYIYHPNINNTKYSTEEMTWIHLTGAATNPWMIFESDDRIIWFEIGTHWFNLVQCYSTFLLHI